MIPAYEEFQYNSADEDDNQGFPPGRGGEEDSSKGEKTGAGIVIKKLMPPKKIQKRFWKQRDNRLYLQFLMENEEEFMRSLAERTIGRLNVRMSSHIKYKNPKQCRSHHQKMLLKCKDVRGIILFLRKELGMVQHADVFVGNGNFPLDGVFLEEDRIYREQWDFIQRRNWLDGEDSHL